MGECSFIPRLTPFVEKFVFGQQYGEVETLGKGDIAVQNSVEGLNMDCLFSQFVNEWSSPLNSGPEILTELKRLLLTRLKLVIFVHAPIEVRCSNVTYSDEPFTDDKTRNHCTHHKSGFQIVLRRVLAQFR